MALVNVTFRLYKLIFLHRDCSDFIKLKTAYAVFLMQRALLNAAGVYSQNRIKCGCVKGWWGSPYQSHMMAVKLVYCELAGPFQTRQLTTKRTPHIILQMTAPKCEKFDH
jgi:hypothetical protein